MPVALPPLVSIIIPCFNGAGFVRDAIESALAQTYPDKEVVVIDDGSADGSLDVIKSFGDAVRWETGPRRGGSRARNRGVELSRGELIQFLDADDLLDAVKIERQVPFLLGGDWDLSYCRSRMVRFGSGDAPRVRAVPPIDDPVKLTLAIGLQTPSVLHRRRDLLAIGGFREDLPCSQERDLHIRLACAGLRLHSLPEPLVTVRMRDQGISSDYLKVLDQHAGIVWNARRMLEERNALDDSRAEALAQLLFRDARHYLQRGEKKKAFDYMRQARQLHSSGGMTAYGRGYRLLYALAGPVMAERLASTRRRHSEWA